MDGWMDGSIPPKLKAFCGLFDQHRISWNTTLWNERQVTNFQCYSRTCMINDVICFLVLNAFVYTSYPLEIRAVPYSCCFVCTWCEWQEFAYDLDFKELTVYVRRFSRKNSRTPQSNCTKDFICGIKLSDKWVVQKIVVLLGREIETPGVNNNTFYMPDSLLGILHTLSHWSFYQWIMSHRWGNWVSQVTWRGQEHTVGGRIRANCWWLNTEPFPFLSWSSNLLVGLWWVRLIIFIPLSTPSESKQNKGFPKCLIICFLDCLPICNHL